MAVGTFAQPNFETQGGTQYKSAIDNSIAAGARLLDGFAVHQKATADLGFIVDAGAVVVDGALTEKAAQTISALTAPSVNPRIDLVVIDMLTGVASVVTGSEAASPSIPAVPDETMPVATIALATTQTTILNADITDRRVLGAAGGISIKDRTTSDSSVTGTTSDTAMFTKSLASLGTNKSYRFVLEIIDLDMGNGTTTTLRIKLGSTTIISIIINAHVCSPVSNGKFTLVGYLHADGSTSSQLLHVRFLDNLSPIGSIARYAQGTASESWTGSLNFILTVQHSSGSNNITLGRAHIAKE